MEQQTQATLDPSQYPKLTDWANEPDLKTLKGDYVAAKPSHDEQANKIKKWTDLLHVTGAAKPPTVKGRSSIQPKLVRRQAEWRYSALTEPFLGSSKLYKISPVTHEDVTAARQNELLLNWQFRTKLNRVKFIDDYVRAVVDEGTAVLKTGWVRNVAAVKVEVPVYDMFPVQTEEEVALLQQALQMREAAPQEYEQLDPAIHEAVSHYDETGEATVAVQNGVTEIEEERVVENRPTVEILNPLNVYIDPTCGGDLDNALFVIYSFETNKAELQKQKDRYKNLDRVNWENAAVVSDGEHTTRGSNEFAFTDATRKKVVAYEYWGYYDIDNDGTLKPFVATWIGDTMIRMEENPFPDGKIPFVLVPYLPVKRDVFGEPDAELLEDNQKLLGATTRGIVDLLGRSANGQQGFAKGMLDPLNRRRYDNGQNYEFNPTMNPMQGIIEHKFPEIPQSAMAMLQLQNQEAEALTGVKSFSGGISGEAYGDVAAGIRGMLDAASKREMAILRRLAQGISQVGRKIIAMNAEYLSEEEVVRVTNDEYVTIKREDLAGEFDLEVDIATAEVDNAKSQDLGFMLQTMGPNMDPQISMQLLAEIAELKRMPALAHRLRNWQPQPDPVAEQLKQLELQKLQAELEKLQTEAEYNRARAKLAASQADKVDLDYVEQETGTQHERDMDKQQAQARGNQALEITKALAKSRKPEEKEPNLAAAVGFNAVSDKLGQGQPARMPSRPMVGQQRNGDPRFNIGSKYYDPSIDPAMNPRNNFS